MAQPIDRDKRIKILRDAKTDAKTILDDDTGKKLIYHAERIADLLGKRVDRADYRRAMSTSQIRKIFGEVKKMSYDPYRVSLLKAKLAYTAGRHHEVADLQEVLDVVLDGVTDEKYFLRFKDLFEAIVAYHTKFGKE